jgi:hypothetical protein
MAESTSALSQTEYMKITSEAAGYGYRATAGDGLTANEVTEITLYVDGGYRDFLNAYDWSFTRPLTTSVLWAAASGTTSGAQTTTLTAAAATFFPTMIGATVTFTVSGSTFVISGYTSSTVVTLTSTAAAEGDAKAFTIATVGEYRLPDNFGGISGDIYYQSNDGRWMPILHVGLSEVMLLLQSTTGTSRPTHIAVSPLEIGTTTGQRFAFLAWRIPNADYTIRYRYQVLADSMGVGEFPYGGSQHAETLKFSCLAQMDRMKFGGSRGFEGMYQKLLAQSIRRDRKFMAPGQVGFSNSGYGYGRYGCVPRASNISVGGEFFP